MVEDRTPPERLKIAMVIDSYDEGRNGAAISTRRFVDLLRKEHDVTVITTGDPAPGKVILPHFYVPFARRVMQRMKTHLALPSYRVLRRAFREADIIHIQFPFLLGLRAVSIARRMKKPIVSTFHIQAEHLAMNVGIKSPAFIRYTYRVWVKRLYNRSQKVICPSNFAREELTRYGLKAPSVVISNGILPLYRPLTHKKFPCEDNTFTILSVGRLAPEKQHEMIFRGVMRSRHRDRIRLYLIGEGPLQEKLEALGKDLSYAPVFRTLTPEELVKYYHMADLYVHAANVEVEAMTVLEAMGCGLPLLIADSPKSATRQFALDERSLFPHDNPDVLAERIDYWIEHPEELRLAAERYTEHAKKYQIGISYEKLLEVYRSCLA